MRQEKETSNRTIIATIVGLSLLVLIGGVALVSRSPNSPQIVGSSEAKAQADVLSHDWGTIPINGGNVQKSFIIKNSGSATLELANVQTSCMCTEAQVLIGDQTSPYFGMHSTSSWIGKLEPGQEAVLVVSFDPAYHGPSGVGQATRIVSVETNDSNSPKLEFTLTALVSEN